VAEELPELIVVDAATWLAWLRRHHAESSGVWLVLARKGVTDPTSLTYAQALDEALCHGWIDGQTGRRDDATFKQRFTPRRSRSIWSKRNVGLAENLVTQGRMHPAGLAEMQRAKADGRWDAAYAGSAEIEVPADLAAALAANAAADAMFAQLNRVNRYAILFRLGNVKRPETRARRIEHYVAMLVRGETLHPQGPPKQGPPKQGPPKQNPAK
jgi:uncharacterized protein YdeI (YjbR/CyaY-like superfamily)